MSERSLRRVEKMACGNEQPGDHDTSLNGKPTVPPIRRGRFELVRDDNQTSNFANRVAFASYTTGRRTSVIQETETASKSATSDVADFYRLFLPIMKHLHGSDAEAQRRLDDELSDAKRTMTSCQRWNIEAELIGKHATDVLKGICDFFRYTVDKQTQEHEFLTKGLKMKEELEHAFRGGLPHDISLKVKRSLSQSDFLEAGHALSGKGLHVPAIPVQSKSLSSIEVSFKSRPLNLEGGGGSFHACFKKENKC
ncbi:uncharacterized protein LOC105440856 [Strongylocentrotus purpuratus]|uniref:Uncharacterized protein n=1 Tax=Strongylocentrotus purpuratus TaxID=7668 RepID=A0A7M7NIW6_STRPU|nr:uncharacterized protein LOC105440856 [Strongylocentrotus purpuratus]